MSHGVYPMTAEEHRLLDEFVSSLFGIHFPEEKREVLAARLQPRLQALHLHRYLDYYLHLQYDSAEEVERLAHLVSNNETYFFRETRQFEALLDEGFGVMPGPPSGEPIRLLCAGCSSGEEPYTLKIHTVQNAAKLFGRKLVIDGLDIDPLRLDVAEKGLYMRRSLRAASEEQIRTCFVRNGVDEYELRPQYRHDVRFSLGNILDTGTYPSPHYHAVFCRNVLIYFSETALHRAIDNFAEILRPGGLLFLGHSESIIGLSDSFETIRLNTSIAYKRV